jgi:DNA invertase Pin-like site-specific DNA recombinase
LENLARLADGTILATVLPPDAPFEEVRSYQTKVPTALGAQSGKKVGRPKKQQQSNGHRPGWKKKIRQEKIAEAFRLHERCKSKRKIGRRLGVAESTVRAWLKRAQT